MRNLRTIASATVVFGVVGPAIGAWVTWFQRPPGGIADLVGLSYVFGSVPALMAGAAYGVVRVRIKASSVRWLTRALWGACAGLLGCLVFFLLVAGYDRLTAALPFDWRLLRLLTLAGVPARAVCAIIMGRRKAP